MTPWRTVGPIFRMALCSSAATAVDLATLCGLIKVFGLWPGAAGVLGCLAGGAVNFALNRKWVFPSSDRRWLGPLLRYGLLVVLGGALVAGGLIQLGIAVLGLPVLLAKGAAAALVLACWNYPVSARLVFARSREKAHV